MSLVKITSHCVLVLAITCLCYEVSAMLGQDRDRPKPELKIKVTVEYQKKQRHLLKITLTNEGDEFKCFSAKLPWSHWHSMTLLGVGTNRQLLPFQEYIDDDKPGTTILRKNESIEASIDLDTRFPRLTEFLSRDGMDLFWSFQLSDKANNKSNRLGGWVFIPKTKQ
jgi:hypothetical protein